MTEAEKLNVMAAQQKIQSAGRLLQDAMRLLEGTGISTFHNYPDELPSFDALAAAVGTIELVNVNG